MPRHDPKLSQFQEAEAEKLWLQGASYAEIGHELGVSRQRAFTVCRPFWKGLADGNYGRELAESRAKGFKGLPDEPRKPGGRPRVVLSSEDLEIRDDWSVIGLGLETIARKHDLKVSYIRKVLHRTPDLFKLRAGGKK